MAAFVTVAEMEAALQRDLDDAAATEALDAACQMPSATTSANNWITSPTRSSGCMAPDGGRFLLPELPVNAVDAVSVTDNGTTTALTAADW